VTSARVSPRAGFFVAKVSPGAVNTPVDEMPEGRAAHGDPGARLGVAFRGGAVVHGVEDLAGGHRDRSLPRLVAGKLPVLRAE
jgi:hypothetical protein